MFKHLTTVTAFSILFASPLLADESKTTYQQFNTANSLALFDEAADDQAAEPTFEFLGVIDQASSCAATLDVLADADTDETAAVAFGALNSGTNGVTNVEQSGTGVLFNIGEGVSGALESVKGAGAGMFLFAYNLAQPAKVANAIVHFDETLQCSLAGLQQGTVGAVAAGYRVRNWRQFGSGVGNIALIGVNIGASAELSAASLARIGQGMESQVGALLSSLAKPVMNGTDSLALAPAFAYALPIASAVQLTAATTASAATALGGGNVLMMTNGNGTAAGTTVGSRHGGTARHTVVEKHFVPDEQTYCSDIIPVRGETPINAIEPLGSDKVVTSINVYGKPMNLGTKATLSLHANSGVVKGVLEKIIVSADGARARLVYDVREVFRPGFVRRALGFLGKAVESYPQGGQAKVYRVVHIVEHHFKM